MMPTIRSKQQTLEDPPKSAQQAFRELKSTLARKPWLTILNSIRPSDGRLLIESLEADRAIGESSFRSVASSYHRVRNGGMSYSRRPCCWRLSFPFVMGLIQSHRSCMCSADDLRCYRFSYCSATEALTAVISTRLHNCTLARFDRERLDMLAAGYLTFHLPILIPDVGTGEMRAFQTFSLSLIDLV